jgi:metal-responsive CopG/Arc/MetJ family transcriptional regulator
MEVQEGNFSGIVRQSIEENNQLEVESGDFKGVCHIAYQHNSSDIVNSFPNQQASSQQFGNIIANQQPLWQSSSQNRSQNIFGQPQVL